MNLMKAGMVMIWLRATNYELGRNNYKLRQCKGEVPPSMNLMKAGVMVRD